MNSRIILIVCFAAFLLSAYSAKSGGKHLFILSGQSNMAGLNPDESFAPIVKAEFGNDNVIIVKSAKGGQPIRRWYKDWQPISGNEPKAQPDLYDTLLVKIKASIQFEEIESVTFVWMQGERDARQKQGEVYEKSLIGLYDQLCADLKRTDVNFIIGRLSDFDMQNEKYPHWVMIRDIQVNVGESNPLFTWVNTDDLNDGFNRKGKEIKNDLHMSAEGYIEMGKRFADQAIRIINTIGK